MSPPRNSWGVLFCSSLRSSKQLDSYGTSTSWCLAAAGELTCGSDGKPLGAQEPRCRWESRLFLSHTNNTAQPPAHCGGHAGCGGHGDVSSCMFPPFCPCAFPGAPFGLPLPPPIPQPWAFPNLSLAPPRHRIVWESRRKVLKQRHMTHKIVS